MHLQSSGVPSAANSSHCSVIPDSASLTLIAPLPLPLPPQWQTISLSVAKNTIIPTPTAIRIASRSRTNPMATLTLQPLCLLSEPMVRLRSLLYFDVESVSSNRSDVIAWRHQMEREFVTTSGGGRNGLNIVRELSVLYNPRMNLDTFAVVGPSNF